MNEVVFGTIPLTFIEKPFNLADEVFGQGTQHPIGIDFSDIMTLFWRTKQFSVSLQTFTASDALSTFLEAGGNFGGIEGALGGLDAVTASLEAPEASLAGLTNIVDKKFNIISNPQQIQGICGFTHYLNGGGCSVLIDFSEILINSNLYYPKIIVNVGDNSSSANSVTTENGFISDSFFDTNFIDFDEFQLQIFTVSENILIMGSIEPAVYF